MRSKLRPGYLMGVGFFGVLAGVIIPFLIILSLLPSTFFWNFLAYTLSVAGLALGVVGAAWQSSIDRHKRKQSD